MNCSQEIITVLPEIYWYKTVFNFCAGINSFTLRPHVSARSCKRPEALELTALNREGSDEVSCAYLFIRFWVGPQ
jgi:hypothetical protein